MLPQLSAELLAQLQVNLLNSSSGGISRLRPLLGLLHKQLQSTDLGHCQVAWGGSSSRSIVTGHLQIPKEQHDRYRTPPKNYVQLLQHIRRSKDVLTLSKLVRQFGAKFDAVHVAAAVAMVPKLYQPPAPGGHLNQQQLQSRKQHATKLLAQLQAAAAPLVPRMYAPQVSSITYALSRCSSLMSRGSSTNPTTQQLLDTMLTRLTKDQSRLLWQGADGAALTRLLHGLSLMGYTPSSDTSSSSGSSVTPSSSGSSGGSSAASSAKLATQQLCKIIAKDPSRLQMRELAKAAWALARISRKRPGLLHAPSTAAAVDAISGEVVARKVWLRPVSMTGVLTAAAWLGRRDEALLAAVCEEAVHQLHDLRPFHLAAVAWSCSTLNYTPPQELLTGLVTQSRRQLQAFNASSLGLLLHGLQGLGSLDKQLLSDIAAGIAAEDEVSLTPRDAVRIVRAFVAVPDAGKADDVAGMAARIASAVRREARNAGSGLITDLVLCYSKLPHYHAMVVSLLGEAVARPQDFTLAQWVKLLQGAARLGLDRVLGDQALEQELCRFYRAADAHLQQYVRQAVLGRRGPAGWVGQGGEGEEEEEQGLLGKLGLGRKSAAAAAEGQGEAELEQRQQAGRQVQAVVQLAALLGQQQHSNSPLSEATASELADAGIALLPGLKLRQLTLLLNAVTSREPLLGSARVQALLVKACEHLQRVNLASTPTATTAVLVELLQPLSKAVNRSLAPVSGEAALQGIFKQLLPQLEGCSQGQLQGVWEAFKRSGLVADDLAGRAQEVAASKGWQLQSKLGSLTVM